MSAPDSPTLVNRNANRAAGVQTRKSAASAMTAPAPAAMPCTAAMIGTEHSRMPRMTSPVIRVKASNWSGDMDRVAPMISLTAPHDQDPHVAPLRELGEQVAQVRVRFERERVELVRAIQGNGGHAIVHLEPEMLPLAGQRGRSTERTHLGRSWYGDLLTAVIKGKYW